MERIKVLVVEDNTEKMTDILEIFAGVEYIQVVGETETAAEALELAEALDPDLMLIGAYVPGGGYKLAEKIAAAHPWIATVLIETELQEETMRKAIFAGAKDVLLTPFTPTQLVDSVYRSFKLEKKKQAIQRDKTPALRKKAREGKILTVFSTKGGVGKTFVSTNLAVALAQKTGETVALVDLDLDFGNAALALNIIPRFTIQDVVNEIHNLDRDLMESYLIPHRSGIKLLAANVQPQMYEFINAEQVSLILKVLQSIFDYVVVDMPARFYGPVDPALHQADLLLLVTTQDVATIRNLKACLVALGSLNFPRHKIKLLLNKAEPRSEIKNRDVETTLGQDLFAVLPAEYRLVSSSLNKGIPVVLLYPRAKVSRNFMELARRIADNETEKQTAADKKRNAVATER